MVLEWPLFTILASTYYDSPSFPRKRRLQYSGYCTNAAAPSDYFPFSLSLSLYLAVLVRLLRNSLSTKGDGSGGAEAPPIPRHTGEKCRMYARRALSFSSRALAQLFRAFLLGARAAIGENPLLLGRGAPPAMKIRAAHSLCPPLYFCRAIYIGSSFVRVSRLWISRLPISRPPRADREFDFAPL